METDRPNITEEFDDRELRLEDRLLKVEKLLAMPDEPVPWRCDRLAADGFVTLLTGEGGEGKSLFTLALAKAVAEGGSVAGVGCKRGTAVMFDAENGTRLIAQRAKAAEVPLEGIEFYEADGFDLQRHVDQFERVIRKHKANLVVLDSLRILGHNARESEADHMAPLMSKIRRLARKTQAAIIVIHHRGKGPDAADYRGSSVIRDQTDMLFVLGRDHNDPEKATRRFIRTSKLRLDAEPEARWFNLSFDADGKFAIHVAEPFEGGGGSRQTAVQLLAQQLRSVLAAHPRTRADLARDLGRNPNDGQVRRALEVLQAQGAAEQVSGGGWTLVSQPVSPQGAGWMDNTAAIPTLLEAA